MSTIKIDFIGFWPGFDKKDNLFYNILIKNFNVEISSKPDFIFVSPLCSPFEYLKYDCIRILFTGEPLVPDFNVFDYAIGFDYLSLKDHFGNNRYYRYPLAFYSYDEIKRFMIGLSYSDAKQELSRKRYFCNYLYGHKSALGEREKIFELINAYKRVESAGKYLNNMPDGKIIPYSSEKMDFLRQCKFTIACESISYPGFITEKIMDPFCSLSIPIYYGNPLAKTEFNPDAFICLSNNSSLLNVVDRVKEVDMNDELYIKMLMQPKMVSDSYLDDLYNGLVEFLVMIFSQHKDSAYRRMRFYIQKRHEDYLNEYRKIYNMRPYRYVRAISRRIKQK